MLLFQRKRTPGRPRRVWCWTHADKEDELIDANLDIRSRTFPCIQGRLCVHFIYMYMYIQCQGDFDKLCTLSHRRTHHPHNLYTTITHTQQAMHSTRSPTDFAAPLPPPLTMQRSSRKGTVRPWYTCIDSSCFVIITFVS